MYYVLIIHIKKESSPPDPLLKKEREKSSFRTSSFTTSCGCFLIGGFGRFAPVWVERSSALCFRRGLSDINKKRVILLGD